MSKLDTISNNYYDTLDKYEFFGEILFYLLSIFSILILYIDKSTHPFFNNLLQVALIVLAIVFFSKDKSKISIYSLVPKTRADKSCCQTVIKQL